MNVSESVLVLLDALLAAVVPGAAVARVAPSAAMRPGWHRERRVQGPQPLTPLCARRRRLEARIDPPPAAACVLRSGTEGAPEPLAIACGVARLRVPLVPRAPGRADAAGRSGVGAHRLGVGSAA